MLIILICAKSFTRRFEKFVRVYFCNFFELIKMLAMQNMKSKRGRKLKSKLVNVTCQTEATTNYLQYNQIFCDCLNRDRTFNRKQILKIIRKYITEETNNTNRNYALMRCIKKRQKHNRVTKTKSDNSVIYVGTKKFKCKKNTAQNLARKSVIYIGTTYNTLKTPQQNDIIDLTQGEPPMLLSRNRNSIKTSLENSSFIQKRYPKSTTKYYKRPLFYSKSDSALYQNVKGSNDLKRKCTTSEYSISPYKKSKSENIRTNKNVCLKEIMSMKLPDIFALSKRSSKMSTAIITNSKNNAAEKNTTILNTVPIIIEETIDTLHADGIHDMDAIIIPNKITAAKEFSTIENKENIFEAIGHINNLEDINLSRHIVSSEGIENKRLRIENAFSSVQEQLESIESDDD